jgi:uncharacterized protein (UPF0261 family)
VIHSSECRRERQQVEKARAVVADEEGTGEGHEEQIPLAVIAVVRKTTSCAIARDSDHCTTALATHRLHVGRTSPVKTRAEESLPRTEFVVSKTVVIVGTLDTKGPEFLFLKQRIESHGLRTLVVNTGILGEPYFLPDISAAEVARAAGTDLSALVAQADRGIAMAAMCTGVAVVAADLHRRGSLDGIIGMGGGAGTTICTSAMRALPFGIPKLMLSTLASGNVSPYVDIKDIIMMPSIVDISGMNGLLHRMISNAAAAIAGMVNAGPINGAEHRPMIAATMFGVTTPCVTRARQLLEQEGYEVLVFHCTGAGGRTMEELIRSGFFRAVLDVTTTELADELVGGIRSAGPRRLEAAGEMGVPQVVSAGAIDMVNFGPPDTIPDRFKSRRLYRHNPSATLMRTTPEENAKLGEIVAAKLNRATGPTRLVMPLRGVSAIDREGQPFHDAAADAAFLRSLRAALSPEIALTELDAHINDPAFADECVRQLLSLVARHAERSGQ